MSVREDTLRSVAIVAEALEADLDRVVIVGASAAAFYDLSPAVQLRFTEDVDVIVEVLTNSRYEQFVGRLRDERLLRDPPLNEDTPICRYSIRGVLVDLLPVDGRVLGFENPWYPDAVKTAAWRPLPNGASIRVVDPTHFVATKLCAFLGRGNGDYFASADIEDVLTVLFGARDLVDELRSGRDAVHEWIRAEFARHLAQPRFRSALPGHFGVGLLPPFDAVGFRRRLEQMVGGASTP